VHLECWTGRVAGAGLEGNATLIWRKLLKVENAFVRACELFVALAHSTALCSGRERRATPFSLLSELLKCNRRYCKLDEAPQPHACLILQRYITSVDCIKLD
jgi:hypothetical protein